MMFRWRRFTVLIALCLASAEPTVGVGHEIEGSERLLTPDYQQKTGLTRKQVEAQFGASGRVQCGEITASAELITNEIIVTTAHLFWWGDHDTRRNSQPFCDVKYRPDECTFTTIINGRLANFPLASIVAAGFQCPLRPATKDHWAIIRLKRPVPANIRPYKIGDAALMKLGEPVLAVNGANGDMTEPKPGTKERQFAKSFGECRWGPVRNDIVVTGCSAAPSSSGSAILNTEKEIVGIAVKSTESQEGLARRVKQSWETGNFEVLRCSFDPQTCATFYIPVVGEFRQALIEAAETP